MDEKERIEAIDELVKFCIEKGGLHKAQEAAELGASQGVIDSLVKALIEEGERLFVGEAEDFCKKATFRAAQKVATLGASQQAIDSLVEACIRAGFISMAQEAAKLGGRELTTEEIKNLIASIQRKN